MGGPRSFGRVRSRPAGGIALLAVMLVYPASASARLFEQPFLFADPSRISGVSIPGDVDGDGHLDLVVVSGSAATVLRGDGNANFIAIQTFTFSSDAVLADLNGDSRADLVTPTLVKLNNGDGSFGPEHAMLGGGTQIQVRDMNADGKLDMLFLGADLRVRAGNGDGTFGAFDFPFTTAAAPVCLTMADVNGDGKPDALVGCPGTPGKISVFLGTGTGSWFQPRLDLTTADSPQSIAVGDLNEDGNADLAVASNTATGGYIHLGNGNGTFGVATPLVTVNALHATIADFDANGHLDVAFSGNPPSGLTSAEVFPGNGNGTFGTRTSWELLASGRLQALHVDDDATWDLLAGNGLLLGHGDGTFGNVRRAATGAAPRRTAIADMDGDGDQDVVVTNSGASSVTVILGNGDGSLGATSTYATGTLPQNVALSDFNHDGRVDIVTANRSAGGVSILLALEGGGFAPKTDIAFTAPLPQDVAAADLNGDTHPDLVIGLMGLNFTGLYTVYLGVGNGTFTPYSSFNSGGAVWEVELAYMDGDNILDLVSGDAHTSGIGFGAVSILHGDGTGGFVNRVTYSLNTAMAEGLAVADMNQDGNLDVIRGNRLFFGNGDGTLQNSPLTVPMTAVRLAVADFDFDGHPDIAAPVPASQALQVAYGDGIGGFPRTEFLGCGLGPVGVEVGQMDAGGTPDLVACNSTGANVTVLLNVYSPVPVEDVVATGDPLAMRGYPNPVESGYRVSFRLSQNSPATVAVMDALGRRVRTLHTGALSAGPHGLDWDVEDANGHRVAAGLYFCELRAEDKITRTKIVVLR